MRIALVCDYALDYLGGAQTALLQQAGALAAAGHEVLLVAPAGRRVPAGLVPPGVEWRRVRARLTLPGLGLPLVRNGRALRAELSGLLAARRIEVVHAHSELGLVAAASAVADDLGIPRLHTVHTLFWRSGLPAALQPLAAALVAAFHRGVTGRRLVAAPVQGAPADAALRRMTVTAARGADAVISPSDHQAALLRAAGLPRVVQLENTVAVPGAARPPALDGAWGPLRVVWAGRATPEKRLGEFVLGAMAAMDVLGPRALRVEIVGEGPDLAAARRMARAHPGIVFLGRRAHGETVRRMVRSHLVALSSHGFDNQPMVVAEACWASRGVLYVDPALREGVATAGALCDDPGAEGIAAELVRLAQDRGEVVALSRQAHAAYELFRGSRHAAALERLADAVRGESRDEAPGMAA